MKTSACARKTSKSRVRPVSSSGVAPRCLRDRFITAFIEVETVQALYAEYVMAGATFDQKLEKQAWGGRDFIVRDADGNGICFVGPGI